MKSNLKTCYSIIQTLFTHKADQPDSNISDKPMKEAV